MQLLRDEIGRDDMHCVFMGAGDAFDEMVALSQELGVADIVDFPGWVPRRVHAALPVHRRRVPVPGSAQPAQRRVDDEQGRRVHGDGPAGVSFDLAEARVSAGDAAVYVRPTTNSPSQRRLTRCWMTQSAVAGWASWDAAGSNRSCLGMYPVGPSFGSMNIYLARTLQEVRRGAHKHDRNRDLSRTQTHAGT